MTLSEYDKDFIKIRGMDIANLMRERSFSEAICLLWRGDLPSPNERRLLDALLVSTVIHTENSPSIVSAQTAFSNGNTLEASVTAGVSAMGPSHGGAVSEFAKVLQTEVNFELNYAEAAKKLVETKRALHQRIPGFGHVLHPRDPRTVALFELAKECNKYGKFCGVSEAIQTELEEKTGKPVPLNITGAMAAVLSELGFDWRIGTGFFIVSRTVGIVATLKEAMPSRNS